MGVALRCTGCDAISVSSLFYRGADAHVCRSCGSPFELADPARNRRTGADRRSGSPSHSGSAEWRSGGDRRIRVPAAV